MARKRFVRIAAISAAVTALAVLSVSSAAAHEREENHEGYGVIAVEGRHPVSPGAINYVVRVTWSADQHAASDAGVTATAISPLGVQSAPIALQPIDLDGRYGGTVVFPSGGAWTVRLASATPAGSVDIQEQVVDVGGGNGG